MMALRLLAVAGLAASLAAPPAEAETWTEFGDSYLYDADTASYDAANDVVLVHVAHESPNAETDRYWMALSCGRPALWIEGNDGQWGGEMPIPEEELNKESNVGYLRAVLCRAKRMLPAGEF